MPEGLRLLAATFAALGLTVCVTPQVIRLAVRTEFLDRPHSYKGHRAATPYLGGIALMFGVLGAALLFAWPQAPNILRWALITSLALCLLGTVDDRVSLSPGIRISLTSLAAVVLWDVHAGWSGLGSPVLDMLVTVAWVLGVVNAFNLMDNMDGASSSVGAVTGLGLGVLALRLDRPGWALVAAALAGASIGFLYFNLQTPAKVFLGDGGSMPLGFLAATLPMTLMAGTGHTGWRPLVACVLLIGVPALDTALVVVSRRRRHVSVTSGARDHLTHRLVTRLQSPRRVALVLVAAQIPISAVGVVLIERGGTGPAVLIPAYLTIAALLICLLEGPRWGVPAVTRFDAAAELARAAALPPPVRVLRIIARLNMGGPAHHVTILSDELSQYGYETLLVHGRLPEGEGSLEHLASDRGLATTVVPTLGPELNPVRDLRALISLIRIVRRYRPDIVHTHTAKAGMLGRIAALSVRPRPVIVHTYHGHVLEGYFGPLLTRFYRGMERALARVSDQLIGVSHQTVEDLVRFRVAPREKFAEVRLGLDLGRFTEHSVDSRTEFRSSLGVGDEDVVLSFVGRLVHIKRVDVLLRAMAQVVEQEPRVHLAIVGDGLLRTELEEFAAALKVTHRVHFLGYRADTDVIAAGADLAVLTSDNEGTPVSLIEAGAAGLASVTTNVGGVSEVVTSSTGITVAAGDFDSLADGIVDLVRHRELRQVLGEHAREHVLGHYGAQRLTAEVSALYAGLQSRLSRPDTLSAADLPSLPFEPLAGSAAYPSA